MAAPSSAAPGGCLRPRYGWGAEPCAAAAQATLVKETTALGPARPGGAHIGVHMANPGMVATHLLLSGPKHEGAKAVINVLAEDASTVAAWLVPRMRGARGTGAHLKCAPPCMRLAAGWPARQASRAAPLRWRLPACPPARPPELALTLALTQCAVGALTWRRARAGS